LTVQYPLENAPQEYADFFQSLDTTGDTASKAPAGWGMGNILTSEVSTTKEIRARQVAAGLHDTLTHTVDQTSPVFAQVTGNSLYGAMECFSVTVTDNMTTASGTPIVQPPDRETFGNLISPGSYSSIKFTKEDDACVGEDATSGVTLDADSGGTYVIVATPSG
jgi:hypothetical protein